MLPAFILLLFIYVCLIALLFIVSFQLLILLLMWAVQSDNNQYFVDLIRLADFEIQHYFKQILEAAMQQEQDGTMQSGEFNLPTIAASGTVLL